MPIIDEFWRMYAQTMFLYHCYSGKRERLVAISRTTTILSFLISAACIAAWGMRAEYALVWAVIILVSQIMTGLKDQFDWSREIYILGLYLVAMRDVTKEITRSWRLILRGELTEGEIDDLISLYEEKVVALEKEYLTPNQFKISHRLELSADALSNANLNALHGKGD